MGNIDFSAKSSIRSFKDETDIDLSKAKLPVTPTPARPKMSSLYLSAKQEDIDNYLDSPYFTSKIIIKEEEVPNQVQTMLDYFKSQPDKIIEYKEKVAKKEAVQISHVILKPGPDLKKSDINQALSFQSHLDHVLLLKKENFYYPADDGANNFLELKAIDTYLSNKIGSGWFKALVVEL